MQFSQTAGENDRSIGELTRLDFEARIREMKTLKAAATASFSCFRACVGVRILLKRANQDPKSPRSDPLEREGGRL